MAESTIDKFLQRVKVAADGTADPGSIGGPTAHPVKGEDNKTQNPVEGEHSAELSSDVKEQVGEASVDAQPEKSAEAGAPNSVEDENKSIQVGTLKKPVGEDPASETPSVNAGREDPGTEHPARVDNDDLDGHKYAGLDFEAMETSKLASVLSEIGNKVLTSMAGADKPSQPAKTAGAQTAPAAGKTAPAAGKTAAVSELDTALVDIVGPDMASLLTGTMDKTAADAMVCDTIAGIIKDASDDATRLAVYLQEVKQAEEAELAAEGGDPSLGAAPDAAMGAGIPPEAMGMAGGDPAGDLGGMGGEMGGDMGGAGGNISPEDIAALEQVLTETNLTVDELIQALQQSPELMAGDPAAGGAPEGGGPAGDPGLEAPMEEPPAEEPKMAAQRLAAVSDKNAAIRNFVLETARRSRGLRGNNR